MVYANLDKDVEQESASVTMVVLTETVVFHLKILVLSVPKLAVEPVPPVSRVQLMVFAPKFLLVKLLLLLETELQTKLCQPPAQSLLPELAMLPILER